MSPSPSAHLRDGIDDVITLDSRRLIATLFRIAVAIAVLGTIVSAIKLQKGLYQQDDDVGARFELHTEGSLAVWFSTLVLVASVPLFAILARRAKQGAARTERYAWTGLAVLFALLSLDELASFHELASILVDEDILGFYDGYNWLVFGIVFVLALAAVYGPFVVRLDDPLRWLLILGGVTFLGGAVGVEAFNANTASTIGDDNYRYLLMTSVEELMEMCGAVLVLFALLDHLGRLGYDLNLRFHRADRTTHRVRER